MDPEHWRPGWDPEGGCLVGEKSVLGESRSAECRNGRKVPEEPVPLGRAWGVAAQWTARDVLSQSTGKFCALLPHVVSRG